ncbi:MAG: serine/threonine protein kinase [Deltaproteobacteria bacterium]|nr:serine/threonine protein kinase [Deltaproteobacteria bacterium]
MASEAASGSAPGRAIATRFGDYYLVESLGKGAMGSVDLARPLVSGAGVPTLVVIKRMNTELADKELFLKRFRHEGEAAVRIDSPFVAKVYDVGTVGEEAYIAMEFIDGYRLSEFLDRLVKSARHVPVDLAMELCSGMLLGLEALRSAVDASGRLLGFVHRDLSPKNLMVVGDGRIRIIDLGLGKSTAQDWKTRTGLVMGSPGYMSPEQSMAKPVDHRSDLYTAGIVIYELLTLRRYIRRGALADVLTRSANPEFTPPSHVRPDLPERLDRVLEKALSADPNRRFSTARELLAALEAVAPATPGSAAGYVQEMFEAERAERAAKLEEWLSIPVEEVGAPAEPTVIFARASGVTRAFESRAREARTVVRSAGPDPSSIAADDAPDTIPEADASPTRVDETDRSFTGSKVAAARPAPRTGVSAPVLAGALIFTAALAFTAGWLFRPPVEPIDAPEVDVPEIGVVGATPRPVPPPSKPRPADPRPAPADPPALEPPRLDPAKLAEPKTEPPKAPVKKPLKPEAEDTRSVDELFKSIMTRGQAILRDHPERADRVQAIIGDATLEVGRADSAAAQLTLRRMDQQLVELAR